MTPIAEDQPVDLAPSLPQRRSLGLSALTGLLLFVVSLGTFAPESSLAAGDATAAEIRRFAADNAGILKLNMAAALIGIVVFVVFIAALARVVRDMRPHSVVPDILVLCGAVIAVHNALNTAVKTIFAFPHEVASVSDSTIVAWYDLDGVVQWFGAMVRVAPCMVVIAIFSAFALRTRLMARWVCWAGLTVAAGGLATAVDVNDVLGPVGLVPLFGWWLWPLAVGGALGVRWLKARRRR
jgi:hypothetical protein